MLKRRDVYISLPYEDGWCVALVNRHGVIKVRLPRVWSSEELAEQDAQTRNTKGAKRNGHTKKYQ